MAKEFILREGVLNDNYLQVAEHGKRFKDGYIAIIVEYQYQNAWCNKSTIKKFKSVDRLIAYLDKNYPEVDYIDYDGTCVESMQTV